MTDGTTEPTLRCHACGRVLEDQAERCPSCGADARVIVFGTPVPERVTGRRRRWPLVAGAVAAAGIVATLWLAGSRAHLRGVPESAPSSPAVVPLPSPPGHFAGSIKPIEYAHGWWFCRSDTLAAYVPGYHFYESNHPLHPDPTVEPAACFLERDAAERAGFGEGALPPGTGVSGGIFIVPLPFGRMNAPCVHAARAVGFAVPCPFALPNVRRGGVDPRCGPTPIGEDTDPPCVWEGGFVFEESRYAVPPGTSQLGSIVIAAARAVDLHGRPDAWAWLTCPTATVRTTFGLAPEFGFGDAVATVFDCGYGASALERATIVRWTFHRVVYQVSVPGGRGDVDLAISIMRGLRLVHGTDPLG